MIRVRRPAAKRALSSRGVAFIAEFEGFRAYPYNDVAGYATIGYGHLLHYSRVTDADLRRWGRITRGHGLKLLAADAHPCEVAVRRLVKVRLTRGEFDALVSFAFNLGTGALAGSTLLRKLNRGDRLGAANEFLKWTHAGGKVEPGLVRRRAAERTLFLRK